MLDLRRNPAVSLTRREGDEKFLAKGELIVTTSRRGENAQHKSSGRVRPGTAAGSAGQWLQRQRLGVVAGCAEDLERTDRWREDIR